MFRSNLLNHGWRRSHAGVFCTGGRRNQVVVGHESGDRVALQCDRFLRRRQYQVLKLKGRTDDLNRLVPIGSVPGPYKIVRQVTGFVTARIDVLPDPLMESEFLCGGVRLTYLHRCNGTVLANDKEVADAVLPHGGH